MTKAALKEKYLEWNREIGKLDARQQEVFHELQELCAEKGDGHKWCCMEKLVEALAAAGEIYKALPLVAEYHNIEDQKEALRNLATATNNFEI